MFKVASLRKWKQLDSQLKKSNDAGGPPEPPAMLGPEPAELDTTITTTKESVRLLDHPQFIRHIPSVADLALLLDCAGDPDCDFTEWCQIGFAVQYTFAIL